jgi:hypothetical protein
VTTRNAEIVQTACNLHHSIRDAFFSEAQDLFDNATAFDPGDRVLDDDTRTGEDCVNADFRGEKSTHIPHGKPQRFQGKRRLFVRGFAT